MKKFISNYQKHFILFLSLFVLITFSGCHLFSSDQSKQSSSLKKVRLCEVAHSIFYAPQYVALELDYFKQEGLNIVLTNGNGADNVMTSLISNDADIGFMGSEASIYIYSEGAENYAINFAGLTQRAGNFLVSRTKDADFKWSDLKDKTVIGGRSGGMPEMVFEYILKKNQINPKDVNIIQNINFGSTAPAFSSGTGDYTIEFEPFATSLENEGKGYVTASLGVESGFVPYTAYCALQSYLNENEDTLNRFTAAIQKGLDYVQTHTAQEIANVIHPQFPETDLATLTQIVARYQNQNTWKSTTYFDQKSYDLLIDILKESNQLKKEAPYTKLVTTKFSKERR